MNIARTYGRQRPFNWRQTHFSVIILSAMSSAEPTPLAAPDRNRMPKRSLLLALSLVSVTANASEPERTVPNLSGLWGKSSIPYERPATGQGPLERLRLPNGQRVRNPQVGDYTSPILKSKAAEAVKRFGEIAQTTGISDAETECWPESPPYTSRIQETQIIQQRDRILIIYSYSNQVRRIRLNAEHPKEVTPSLDGRFRGALRRRHARRRHGRHQARSLFDARSLRHALLPVPARR